MRGKRGTVILPILLALLAQALLSPRAAAQSDAAAPAPPFVSVGKVDGSPGASLIVPLYYTADPGTPIRSFTVEIEFVSNNLSFQDATKGIVDQEGLEISSSLAKGTADAKGVTRSKLHLAAALSGGDAKQPLAGGLLAYLMFQLSPDAKPFVITLNPAVLEARSPQGGGKAVLRSQAGSITVLSEDVTPEMSCFFFTH
jgi:hypothetical protein